MNHELRVEALKLLSSGVFTIDTLASKLSVDKYVAKELIDYLVIRGYVNEVEIGPECRSKCATCQVAKSCPFYKLNLNTKIKIYVITEKGVEYIKRYTKVSYSS